MSHNFTRIVLVAIEEIFDYGAYRRLINDKDSEPRTQKHIRLINMILLTEFYKKIDNGGL